MQVYKVYRQNRLQGLVISHGPVLEPYLSIDFELELIQPDKNGEIKVDTVGTELGTIVIESKDSLIGKKFHDGAHVYTVDSFNKKKNCFNVHLVGQPAMTALYGETYIRKTLIKR